MKRTLSVNSIAIFCTLAYFTASFLTRGYAMTDMIMAGGAVAVMVCACIRNGGKLRIHIELFHVFTVLFCAYCYITTIWAIETSWVTMRATVILKILVCLYLIYVYFQDSSTEQLLEVVALAGYFVCVITLINQGVGTYFNAIFYGQRVYEDEYINANMLGMVAASSTVINFYFILYKKEIKRWTILFIPAAICMIASASKKAVILVVLGILMLLFLKNYNGKKVINSLFKSLIVLLIFCMLVYFLMQLPAFQLVNERFARMFDTLTGKRNDTSTTERRIFITLGIQLFKANPIFGIGVDNARLYTARQAYLHNNYVELLADGGIVGFLLYYLMYAYLLWNMFKYRRYRDKVFDVCLVLIFIHMVLEYAYVAYYNKETYFYFMLWFLEVKNLKQAAQKQHARREMTL